MNESEDDGRLPRGTSPLEVAAFTVALVAFAYVGGLVGGALGMSLVVARLVVAPMTVYALAHVVGLALPWTPTLLDVAMLEAPLLLLLVVAGVGGGADDGFVPALAVAVVGLTGLAAGGLSTFDPLWQTAGLVVVAFGLVAYGLHRYELVRLGLVAEST
jgi:hypothetical protein